MSATGRGKPRAPNDYYPTPPWVTHAILRRLGPQLDLSTVLDPCAGDGAILRAVREFHPTARVCGIELSRRRATMARAHGIAVEAGDALKPRRVWPLATTTITNPPYGLALDFVARALAESNRKPVLKLLRLNWLEGKKRVSFHRRHPADIFVLPKRPSFKGRGTDATAYAWFVWGLGGGRWEILDVEWPRRAALSLPSPA